MTLYFAWCCQRSGLWLCKWYVRPLGGVWACSARWRHGPFGSDSPRHIRTCVEGARSPWAPPLNLIEAQFSFACCVFHHITWTTLIIHGKTKEVGLCSQSGQVNRDLLTVLMSCVDLAPLCHFVVLETFVFISQDPSSLPWSHIPSTKTLPPVSVRSYNREFCFVAFLGI